eukprot:NODE_504_length_6695_cov_1.218163.p3 type:complete len:296 gc:universal NODE_504_length_6695_cov_1.218163:2660-1773(-)
MGKLPVICAPMFLISNLKLCQAACKAGIIGSFPALNARSEEILDSWMKEMKNAEYAVNLIVHKSNKRLQGNLDKIVKHKVPIVITSLGLDKSVIKTVQSYGGRVFHDVANLYHAEKASEAGVDGIIAVCSGAGGHSGSLSPFAMLPAIRKFFDRTLIAAGAISDGRAIKASQVLGADYAYLGTRFIATKECDASDEYKQMIVSEKTGPAPFRLPIVLSDKFTGVHANFLRKSIENNNIDLEALQNPKLDFSKLDMKDSKAWKDIWSAGHGVVNIYDIPTVKDLVDTLKSEYDSCK